MTDIYGFLNSHGLIYERHDHPAVFTCEEAERLVPPLPAAKVKNLFMRDRKGLRHFLVMVGYHKAVDLKALSSVLGSKGLSFASPDRLKRHLGVDPGSVTVLSLVHDGTGAVEVIVDEALWRSEAIQCHPLVNTSTLVIPMEEIRRFLDLTGHEARVLDVPGRESVPLFRGEGA